MEDNDKVWPPTPSTSLSASEASKEPAPPMPYLAVILVMWALTLGQFLLQLFAGLSSFGQLLGLAGFVIAVFLVTRKQKAARVNGWLRLGIALLGLLFHLLARR